MAEPVIQDCKKCGAKVLGNPHRADLFQYEVAEEWLPMQAGYDIFATTVGIVKGHAVHWCRPFEVEESGA